MSNHRHVKVTAYLKFACPKTVAERTGPVPCCGRNPIGAYCHSCGKPAKYEAKLVPVDAVSQGDIAQEIHESMCYLQSAGGIPTDGFDIWHPNGPGLIDDDAAGHQVITCDMIEEAKQMLVMSYSDDIATLTRHYGSAPEICFGMLVWWM